MTKLANYFGVSISYLTGESDYKSEQEAMWDAQYNSEALSDESIRIEKGCRIPVLSQIVADVPIESIEEVLDWEEIPFRLANTGEFFGLKMKDDSISPRIESSDVLIVKQQSNAESGDIVIAQINDDACVKKFLNRKVESFFNRLTLHMHQCIFQMINLSELLVRLSKTDKSIKKG